MVLAILVLSPSIIAVALFIYSFIGWTFYISTVDWNTVVPNYTFVGLKNWLRLFGDNRFHADLRNLIYYAIGFMSQCIIFGFLIAAFLDQRIRGEALFRTIVIFPFAVSGIVTGVAWRWLMQPTTGINLLFANIGFENFQPVWNTHPKYGMWAVTIAAAWQFTGYVMALYLAGLRGIPHELREAAAIDGAGTLATYRYVIIPLLMPVTFTVIVLTGMNSIRVFDLVSAMSGSGPAFATDTLAFYMFQSTFGAYRFSLGAAIGAFMIILSGFLVAPYLLSMRRETER
jgi:glucose/mannose transport system permease protein